jgi:hypothetical protein
MRYADLKVVGSTPDDAKTSIIDLVSVASGNGRTEIPMSEILSVMHQQGWDISRRMIMDILQDNEMIERITKDSILLKNENQVDPADVIDKEKQRGAEHVDKLAMKAMNKSR